MIRNRSLDRREHSAAGRTPRAPCPLGRSVHPGWALVFTLPGGQAVTSGWNADYSPASGRVTARNVSHNATIAPGGSVDIGFQAAHTGDTATPNSYTLNGTACAVTGSSVK
ncbi:hypothetical protein AQJ91_46190 [Streptomyces dysideae]|uniref:CBM2 domain-containing protein n=1 Tax=Streptomyces dysideae TaxID=909626 RepID=A0A101UPP5_9ACTN|nr:hypothetical protein AQJ91_46190 [Streptomyces dysideae]